MMKKLIFMLIVAFACAGTADAQGWLKKLGKVAEDAAKRTVESNVDRKTSQAVDDAMNPDPRSPAHLTAMQATMRKRLSLRRKTLRMSRLTLFLVQSLSSRITYRMSRWASSLLSGT